MKMNLYYVAKVNSTENNNCKLLEDAKAVAIGNGEYLFPQIGMFEKFRCLSRYYKGGKAFCGIEEFRAVQGICSAIELPSLSETAKATITDKYEQFYYIF